MSSVVLRVSAQTVRLTDGRLANVVVFAYQPYSGFGRETENHRMWLASGIAQSDRLARNGKLTGLVVHGFKNDKTGKIEVAPGTPVYENRAGASFWDHVYGDPKYMTRVAGVTVPGTLTYTAGTVGDGSRLWMHPDGTQMPKGFVPRVNEVPPAYRDEVAALGG